MKKPHRPLRSNTTHGTNRFVIVTWLGGVFTRATGWMRGIGLLMKNYQTFG